MEIEAEKRQKLAEILNERLIELERGRMDDKTLIKELELKEVCSCSCHLVFIFLRCAFAIHDDLTGRHGGSVRGGTPLRYGMPRTPAS